MTMDVPYYSCEDCGAEFAKTELLPDVEDDLLVSGVRRPRHPAGGGAGGLTRRGTAQAPASAGGSPPGPGAFSPALPRW